MKRRGITMLLLVCFLLSITVSSASESNLYEEISSDTLLSAFELEEDLPDQTNALLAYERIMASFDSNARNHGSNYPDEYGGEYIEGEALYVLLTDTKNATINKYKEIVSDIKNVIYAKADFSLAYLESLNSIADELCDEYNISGYGTDRKNNRFVIRIHSPNVSQKKYSSLDFESTKSALLKYFDSNAVIFQQEELNKVYTDLVGGQALSSSTLGIGGTYQGNDAILVAGHSYNPNGNENPSSVNVYNASGYHIATTELTNFYYGCYGDYSIALCESGYSSTNAIYSNSGQTYRYITGVAYSGNTPVGTTVYKYGKAGRYAVGTVTYLNQTALYGPITDVQVKGLNYFSISLSQGYDTGSGDSGGPVYISSSGYKIVGTISGGPASNDTAQYSKTIYYSPIYYAINDGFSVKTS